MKHRLDTEYRQPDDFYMALSGRGIGEYRGVASDLAYNGALEGTQQIVTDPNQSMVVEDSELERVVERFLRRKNK